MLPKKQKAIPVGFFPVGDELNELGYNHMFMDMFNSMEQGKPPKKLFMMAM